MNFIVTVGTASFDSLIRVVDELSLRFPLYKFYSQIGLGTYVPQNHSWCRFEDDILGGPHQDSLVITHMGAGTVFSLLEKSRPFIGIPNLERPDKHQKELYCYVQRNHFALTLHCPQDLWLILEFRLWEQFKMSPYVKDEFFLADELRSVLGV